jgi:aldose 1-epimerase
MVPFVNRLKPAWLAGGAVRFPENWPSEQCAIHGTGWMAEWDVARVSRSSLTMHHRARDQTGAFDCLSAHLREEAVEFDLRLANDASLPIPVGLGLHPWFALADDLRIDFQARWQMSVRPEFPSVVELSDRPRLSPAEAIDDCFAGWNGEARLLYPSQGFGLEITADETLNALHVFIDREWNTLCLEPVSHGPNAAHNERVAAVAPMHLLEPRAEFAGRTFIRPFETDRR